MGARARERVLDEHTYAHRARRVARARSGLGQCAVRGVTGAARARRSRSCPPTTRSGRSARVVDEIRAFDPALDVVVVDDGSTDGTAPSAAAARRRRRPAPVQPRHRRRRADRLQLRAASRATSSPSGSTATASTTRRSSRAARAARSAARRTSSSARASSTAASAYRPPLARRIGIAWFAQARLAADAPAGDRHDLGLPGAQPRARSRSSPPTTRTTTRRSRRRVMVVRHRLRLDGGAGADARARARPLVDHVRSRSVYYMAQGDARAVRRPVPPHAVPRREERMTPLRISIVASIASLLLLLRRARADPQPAPAGALRAPLARDRPRAARALGLARRAQHDRRLVRRRAGYPPAVLFAVAILFVIVRAAPLLDGALEARPTRTRSSRSGSRCSSSASPCAAGRAATGTRGSRRSRAAGLRAGSRLRRR